MAETDTIWVRPAPGLSFRHPKTKQLVAPEGFQADANDLDIARSLGWGSLVLAEPPAEAEAASAAPPKKAAKPRKPKVSTAPAPAAVPAPDAPAS